MKILHLCLSCFYIDDMGYQENLLVRQHVRDGHEVLVIASTETMDDRGSLTYGAPGTYTGSDGARVVRIPYVRWLPHRLARKLRIHPGVYDLIAEFRPEAILFHGCAGNELVTAAAYVRDNPGVIFYADSHEDFGNSARNFLSRNVLHRIFYRHRLQRALPQIRKILCVGLEVKDFLRELYGVPEEKMEFFPLGGFALGEEEMLSRRQAARAALGVGDEEFVFLQSGKITARKKLADSLRSFAEIEGEALRFLIVGLLADDIRAEVEPLIEADPRVHFLGWKSPEELTDLLCAADCYVQPGTQSATMQHALCCGCPVIIDAIPSHEPYVAGGAVLVDSVDRLREAMRDALCWDREARRRQAREFAAGVLDYGKLAGRVLL